SELRSTRSRLQREQRIAGERSDWFDASPDALIDAARAAELIEQLPAAQREALVLRIWSGLGFAEIADVMNISTSTA
ncbi:MAG TPA: sigma factor-like helix-turn-helix DNA-binding protein, partial [Tepidisphaeraceae bacterium]|nr:sigma factor-like helix-turn-helix DNA-binding protein [Tepidisphaeraceae bacterium]